MKNLTLAACLALLISVSASAGDIPGDRTPPPPPPPSSMASTSSMALSTVLLSLLTIIR